MEVAIISDQHFGYAWGTEREEDSFNQAREAFKKAIPQADLILLPGDIFDSRIPKQEVMERAARILSLPLDADSSGAKLVDSFNKDTSELAKYTTGGIPVIGIHGTHERRGSNMANPVETLEAAGLLIHLHSSTVVFEKNNEKVALHGMSGVPESYAPKSLQAWAPQPVEGACNILVLHQSFKEKIYQDAAFLTYQDFPPGFDLYVNGHIHWRSLEEKNGKKILHPGSTITTQMRKKEAEIPKSFCFYHTKTGEVEFVELESQRKLYYKELKSEKAVPSQVIEKAQSFLDSLPKSSPSPMVKIKLKGSLRLGSSLDTHRITDQYKKDFVLSLDDEMSSQEFRKKIDSLRKLHQKKASVLEKGTEILEENLEQADYQGIPPGKILGILEEGETEKVLEEVMKHRELGEQKEKNKQKKEREKLGKKGLEKKKKEEKQEEEKPGPEEPEEKEETKKKSKTKKKPGGKGLMAYMD